jgi:coproporphyrinogen III oxidase-like Fe-S oxidoreductase
MSGMNNEAWMSRRTALHDRYLQAGRVGDASRLAYLHGPTQVWTEEEVAALWDKAVRDPVGELEPFNCVYIHVPFCKSICNFCNYDRLQPSSPELLKKWLARVLRSIGVIAPALRPLTFHALYVGGGTPSVLPARFMHELFDTLDAALRWHPQASRKLEFDPAVMNRERLDVLATHGFKELSFGLETLDPEVNARHNRGRQGIEVIERCFADLQAVGISDVACDFLLGLEGTTPEGMLDEMETVLRRFQPAWLDIFMLTPTRSYINIHFGGSWEAFWEHIGRFEALVPGALPDLAERTGYVVRMGHGHHMMLARRPKKDGGSSDRPTEAHYSYTALTSEARRPLNVFGLGRSARSTIFGTAAFALRDPGDSPWSEGPAHYVGNVMTVADEARTFLVHYLRDNDTVERHEFRQIFGNDMTEVIPRALAAWETEGTARLEDDVLRFVPQDRRARIRSLLWLVPQEALEVELAHFDELDLTPSGIGRLAAAIEPGTALAGGHRFAGADDDRLLLRTPANEMLRLRLAPALEEDGLLRLVLDAAPHSGDSKILRRAVGQLRTLLTDHHRKSRRGKSHRS